MKDPKDEVDREPAGHEKCKRGGDLDQHPSVLSLVRLRLRLWLGRQLGPDFLFLPAFAGLQVIDQPRLDDELAGLQGVDVILPVASAADDADVGETAVELIDHTLGDGGRPR
jgi:hypothetical protein